MMDKAQKETSSFSMLKSVLENNQTNSSLGETFSGRIESSNIEHVLKAVKDTQEAFQKQQRRLVALLDNALDTRDSNQLFSKTFSSTVEYETPGHTTTFQSSLGESPHGSTVDVSHSSLRSAGGENVTNNNLPSERDLVEPKNRAYSNIIQGNSNFVFKFNQNDDDVMRDRSDWSNNDSRPFNSVQSAVVRIMQTVDFDAQRMERHGALVYLRALVRAPRFDFIMGVIILANSVYIGIEIEDSIGQSLDDQHPVLEYVFVGIYSLELILRLWAFGPCKALQNKWNILDLFLVGIGIMSLLILDPIRRNYKLGNELGWTKQVILIRMLRLLRLVRAFRFLKQFKILWGLVNGLLGAFSAILSTFALLFLLLYMFAVGGVELITKDEELQTKAQTDPELRFILARNFDTLPMVAVTLMRFALGDSIAAIYEPLVRAKPVLIVYFVMLMLVISITIMNLVTAVLVEHSLAMAKNDAELDNHRKRRAVRKLIPEIESLFQQLDANQDGKVTFEEAISSPVHCPKDLTFLMADPNLFRDLFELLDRDHSGHIDIDEFKEGLIDLALSDVSIETVKLVNYSRLLSRKIGKVKRQLHQLHHQFAHCMAFKDPVCFIATILNEARLASESAVKTVEEREPSVETDIFI